MLSSGNPARGNISSGDALSMFINLHFPGHRAYSRPVGWKLWARDVHEGQRFVSQPVEDHE